MACKTSDKPVIYVSGDRLLEMTHWLDGEGFDVIEVIDPASEIASLPEEAALLLFAPDYPQQRLDLPELFFTLALEKNIKLYVEYPEWVPGITLGKDVIQTRLERGVVSSEAFGPELPVTSILGINDCHITPSNAENPLIVLAKVAGLDYAPYGLEDTETYPMLVSQGNFLFAFTKLSNVASGRYGPENHWKTLWGFIITQLTGKNSFTFNKWPRFLAPSFDSQAVLTVDDKRNSVKKGVDWFYKGRFFLNPSSNFTFKPKTNNVSLHLISNHNL
jgi:hypothetical protein